MSATRFGVMAAVLSLGPVGCVDETLAPVDATLRGTLTLELRDSATIEIRLPPNDAPTTTTLTLAKGFGVAPAGVALTGAGTVERFPEASGTLYTAKLAADPQPAGPCGSEPISLALSLHRQGDNAVVHGGLSAYCGAERWQGRPRRVLRLTGALGP